MTQQISDPADHQRMLQVAAAQLRENNGERLSEDDLRALHYDAGCKVLDNLFGVMATDLKADKTPLQFSKGRRDSIERGFAMLVGEMFGISVEQTIKRRELEDRVAALEAGQKPRIRRQAGSRIAG